MLEIYFILSTFYYYILLPIHSQMKFSFLCYIFFTHRSWKLQFSVSCARDPIKGREHTVVITKHSYVYLIRSMWPWPTSTSLRLTKSSHVYLIRTMSRSKSISLTLKLILGKQILLMWNRLKWPKYGSNVNKGTTGGTVQMTLARATFCSHEFMWRDRVKKKQLQNNRTLKVCELVTLQNKVTFFIKCCHIK
jgi:hypothetical protein